MRLLKAMAMGLAVGVVVSLFGGFAFGDAQIAGALIIGIITFLVYFFIKNDKRLKQKNTSGDDKD
jgi:uncharacterized membrane protein YoaK (UPF0700 family)